MDRWSGPRGRWNRVAIAIGIAGALQLLNLLLLSAATRSSAAIPAMYLAPLATVAASLVVLASPRAFRPRRLADMQTSG